jgi:hypothetical protein
VVAAAGAAGAASGAGVAAAGAGVGVTGCAGMSVAPAGRLTGGGPSTPPTTELVPREPQMASSSFAPQSSGEHESKIVEAATQPTGVRAIKRLGGPDLAVSIWECIEDKLGRR